MALILGDGFDHYPTALILSKWDGARGCTISLTYGRLGTQGCQIDTDFSILGQGGLSKNLPAANAAHGHFGLNVNIPVMHVAGYMNLIAVYDPATGSAMHVCSMIGADGSIAVGYIDINNSSVTVYVLATSVPGLIVAATPVYLETKIKVANTGGFVEVLVNGVSKVTFTGDTAGRGAGGGAGITVPTNQYFTNVKVGGMFIGGTGKVMYVDDFYYCDDTGSVNNTYLGDVQLQAIYPNGVGSSAAWTPIGVVNNWDAVNETSPDDNTTYNKSLTINALDMFTMEDISATAADVKGLLCNARLYKDDATTRTYALGVQTGVSAVTELATRSAPGGYSNQQDVSQLSPASGTLWTVAEVNAMQHGIKVKS